MKTPCVSGWSKVAFCEAQRNKNYCVKRDPFSGERPTRKLVVVTRMIYMAKQILIKLNN